MQFIEAYKFVEGGRSNTTSLKGDDDEREKRAHRKTGFVGRKNNIEILTIENPDCHKTT